MINYIGFFVYTCLFVDFFFFFLVSNIKLWKTMKNNFFFLNFIVHGDLISGTISNLGS